MLLPGIWNASVADFFQELSASELALSSGVEWGEQDLLVGKLLCTSALGHVWPRFNA